LSHRAFFESFEVLKTDLIFFTPEFLKEFQNSEYEVHQVGSNEACSQNFSFLALNTAELAAPQILSKNLRQRRVTDALNSFFRYKKSVNVKI
jgi:hypothetical protein